MNFEKMAKNYLASPKFEGLSLQTKNMYELYVNRLITLGGKLPVTDKDMPDHVARSQGLSTAWYKLFDSYKDGKKKATNPMKNMLHTTLRLVYGWGVQNGYLKILENPVPHIPRFKHQKATQQPYSKEDMTVIRAKIEKGLVPENLLPYAKFMLAAHASGCRPEEMYNHEDSWFTRRDGSTYMEIHNAKGRAEGEISRYIIMQPELKEIVSWFKTNVRKERGHEHYTFRTDLGRQFTQSCAWNKFKELCELCGIEHRAFYNTRRGLATEMHNAGHTLSEIAYRLGNTEKIAKGYINADQLAEARKSFRGF